MISCITLVTFEKPNTECFLFVSRAARPSPFAVQRNNNRNDNEEGNQSEDDNYLGVKLHFIKEIA